MRRIVQAGGRSNHDTVHGNSGGGGDFDCCHVSNKGVSVPKQGAQMSHIVLPTPCICGWNKPPRIAQYLVWKRPPCMIVDSTQCEQAIIEKLNTPTRDKPPWIRVQTRSSPQ